LLSWVVAIAFVLGTLLRVVDTLNLVATRPNLEGANLIDSLNGSAAYRQAIWPVFLWTNLLFAIGFAASVAFASTVSAARGGLPTFLAIVIVGGTIGAISSVIPIGSVEASVWQQYCDCGFKEQEMVSQFWAQGVTEAIADWLNRFASIAIAIGLLVLVRDAGRVISSSLRLWTWLTVAALVAAPLMLTVEFLGQPDLPEWVNLIAGAVLVPVWAIWLGRSVEAAGPAGA
jgi:hypothetical protein